MWGAPWAASGVTQKLRRRSAAMVTSTSAGEAVRLRPNYANAWGNLGLSAISIEQYGEAREAFDRARALQPGYFESRPIQRHAWEIVSRLGHRPDSR